MLLKLLTPLVLLLRTVNGAADRKRVRNWRRCCLVREPVRQATHSENQMNQNHRRQRPPRRTGRLTKPTYVALSRVSFCRERRRGTAEGTRVVFPPAPQGQYVTHTRLVQELHARLCAYVHAIFR